MVALRGDSRCSASRTKLSSSEQSGKVRLRPLWVRVSRTIPFLRSRVESEFALPKHILYIYIIAGHASNRWYGNDMRAACFLVTIAKFRHGEPGSSWRAQICLLLMPGWDTYAAARIAGGSPFRWARIVVDVGWIEVRSEWIKSAG